MTPEQTKDFLVRLSQSYDDGVLTPGCCPRVRVFHAGGVQLTDVVALVPVEGYAWVHARHPETGHILLSADGTETVRERIRLMDPEYHLIDPEELPPQVGDGS